MGRARCTCIGSYGNWLRSRAEGREHGRECTSMCRRLRENAQKASNIEAEDRANDRPRFGDFAYEAQVQVQHHAPLFLLSVLGYLSSWCHSCQGLLCAMAKIE